MIFLKLDKIPGECQELEHMDWIEVFSISFGSSAAYNPPGPEFNDISIQKSLDRASLELFEASWQSRVIDHARLDFYGGSGDNKLRFLTIDLSGVRISSISIGGSSSSGLPSESVSLGFEEITLTYVRARPDGSAGNSVVKSWKRPDEPQLSAAE